MLDFWQKYVKINALEICDFSRRKHAFNVKIYFPLAINDSVIIQPDYIQDTT